MFFLLACVSRSCSDELITDPNLKNHAHDDLHSWGIWQSHQADQASGAAAQVSDAFAEALQAFAEAWALTPHTFADPAETLAETPQPLAETPQPLAEAPQAVTETEAEAQAETPQVQLVHVGLVFEKTTCLLA